MANSVDAGADTRYNIPLGYLRAVVIVLVVLHHAAIGYFPFVPSPPASSLADHFHSLRAITPVIDAQRSMALAFVVIFNDKFFMSLLFFLSGLFVWRSLQSKGTHAYVRDRLKRIGIPFLAMTLLAPAVFYTTYLQTGGHEGLRDYWIQWVSLGHWSSGPAWFLWVLLVFDLLAALVLTLVPVLRGLVRRMPPGVLNRQTRVFAFLFLISAVAYIPMTTVYDPDFSWSKWGPFAFQTSRIFLYMVYFLSGVIFGVYGIERTLLTPASKLARRWVLWVVLALLAFATSLGTSRPGTPVIITAVFFLLSCAASSFAFLAIFMRFARRRSSLFDSLSANCYGVYVIHYGVVAWMLYAMLRAPLPAAAKGVIVFVCALALCWGIIAAIRRNPAVARVI